MTRRDRELQELAEWAAEHDCTDGDIRAALHAAGLGWEDLDEVRAEADRIAAAPSSR